MEKGTKYEVLSDIELSSADAARVEEAVELAERDIKLVVFRQAVADLNSTRVLETPSEST